MYRPTQYPRSKQYLHSYSNFCTICFVTCCTVEVSEKHTQRDRARQPPRHCVRLEVRDRTEEARVLVRTLAFSERLPRKRDSGRFLPVCMCGPAGGPWA